MGGFGVGAWYGMASPACDPGRARATRRIEAQGERRSGIVASGPQRGPERENDFLFGRARCCHRPRHRGQASHVSLRRRDWSASPPKRGLERGQRCTGRGAVPVIMLGDGRWAMREAAVGGRGVLRSGAIPHEDGGKGRAYVSVV